MSERAELIDKAINLVDELNSTMQSLCESGLYVCVAGDRMGDQCTDVAPVVELRIAYRSDRHRRR